MGGQQHDGKRGSLGPWLLGRALQQTARGDVLLITEKLTLWNLAVLQRLMGGQDLDSSEGQALPALSGDSKTLG